MTVPKTLNQHWYADEIFILFKRPEHVKPFVDYMNSKH